MDGGARRPRGFSIGSTTDGIGSNTDGSLTVYVQHTKPQESQLSNWLPAPPGPFNLTMRYYTPLSPVLDKSYRLPPVRRT